MIRYSALLAGMILLWSAPALSAEPPFVAGFDRFIEYEQIPRETGGRLLLTELSCTACHRTPVNNLQPKRGPNLDGVGTRVGSEWLQRYLSAPHDVKPGTTMPDLLAGLEREEKEKTISRLAAFLGTLRESYPEVRGSGAKPVPFQFWNKGNPARGEKLYHTIGCVACHAPDEDYETAERKPTPLEQMLEQLDPEEIEELGLARLARPVRSVPHGDLAGKYTPESLTFFLLDPVRSRPAGRMPDFQLTPVEAADVAAYLISRHPRKESDVARSAPSTSKIEAGRKLFVEIGCANCHSVKGLKPVSAAKQLAKLDFDSPRRCTSPKSRNLPQYQLADRQRQALRTAVANSSETSEREILDFTLLQMNCFGCHERDERGGVGRNRKAYFETVRHVDLGDEGRLPPPLTGVGRKLTPGWMRKVLDGSADVRPYLTARMPEFPKTHISELPSQFALADEYEQQSAQQVFGETEGLPGAGRKLFDTGCVKCHPIRGEALPGVIGVDLHDATSRIHPEWFRQFLFDPGAVKPRTRMPTFFPDGVSSNKEILNGNVDRQIASLWAYLKESDKHPLPEQVLAFRARNFELIPRDRPIILRTFMKEAGTHAIGVGFPGKLNFAYDAEQVRLAQIWKGRFLDAQSTWFERFAPPADPLGGAVITLPKQDTLLLTDADGNADPDLRPEFRGYRLAKGGVPVFLTRLGPLEIEERIVPTTQNTLVRSWTIAVRKDADFRQQLQWRPLSKTARPTTGAHSFVDEDGLKTTLLEGVKASDVDGDAKVFILSEQPTNKHAITLMLEYQW